MTRTNELTLGGIEALCREYAQARERLAETGGGIKEEQRAAVRRRLYVLRRRIAQVAAAKESLMEAIAGAPHLFARPRTRAFEGVKVGYRKGQGKVEFDDMEAKAIQRIRKRLPEHAAQLVRVKETIDKNAARKLGGNVLAAAGISIIEVGDEAVVAAAPDDLDKLVDALLADAPEEAVA